MHHTGSVVKEEIDIRQLIEVISDVLHRYSKKDPSIEQPLRTVLPIGSGNNFLLNLPCIDTTRGYMSVKTITSFPSSEPSIDGLVSLFSSETGRLLLTADAKEITAQRTAATSFLATEILAITKWSKEEKANACLAILGCGVQGRAHLDFFTQLHPWKRILLWSRTKKQAEVLRSETSAQCSNIVVLEDLDDPLLKQADVICTCTSSVQALIGLNQVKSSVHINAVGSFQATMRELADDLLLSPSTSIIVDSRESAGKEAGELIQSKAPIEAELGELIADDDRREKVSREKRTIFKSVGLAVEDLAAMIVLHEKKR